jgi:hypothetical protein
MAVHARLTAPPVSTPREWPWHTAKWISIPARVLGLGDRRMEAETYLSSGYGLRIAIEGKGKGWKSFGHLARVTMPYRTKATLVGQEFGTPFLAATQVFDIRPFPRKWLAMDKIDDAAALLTKPGQILVTRSGNVGRAILATEALDKILISDDLLRIEAREQKMWGWLYAYLRSSQARAIMTGSHYGHMIKHLETSHLDALPVPTVSDSVAADFNRRAKQILEMRNRAYQLTLEAEAQFEQILGSLKINDWGENGFTVRASDCFLDGRRRFEATPHNPGITAIRKHLAKRGASFISVREAGYDVWVPGRYKRIPAEDGVVYYDSADLLEVSPDTTKRFADCRFGDEYRGRVKSDWLLMPCSGQVYGIIGSVVIAGESLKNQVVSNHVLRIAPKAGAKVRSGYLLTVLSHPLFGRPLIKSLAFGSSVPELEPEDVAKFEIVRLGNRNEESIADLAEQSTSNRTQADLLERELADEASQIIDRFLAGSK